jgi:type I restriction enzyme M protein
VADGVDRETAEHDPDEHEFFLPPACRWDRLVSTTMGLGEALNQASIEIETANPRLNGILRATNWNDDIKLGSPPNRDGIIRRLFTLYSGLNLRNDNLENENVLGEAYEYLIKEFADDAGKKGGEFYTPRGVVQLLVDLLEPCEGMRICDPTAGSCGMLIWSALYVRKHDGNPKNLALHGQEKNLGTLGLGKLNLLLHGLTSARIEGGDTIRDPKLADEKNRLLAYDRVIANPPFSLKDWGADFAPKDPHHRFDGNGIVPGGYGALPPKTKGDLAFLEHMIATTNATGMIGVVMPHGVLFRGGAEGVIRQSLVRANLFEAIIGLAPNLFYGASIPVAICVLNRAKRPEHRGKVLFIDAAQEGYFRAGKAQNFLERGHIDRIVAAYQAYEDVPRFAHVADLAEIEANDFNLNISRYVDTTVEVERIDIGAALARLRELERERDAAVATMNRLLAELGYAESR